MKTAVSDKIPSPTASTKSSLLKNGFKLFKDDMSPILKHRSSSFEVFKQSWENLKPDAYLLNNESYRRRRYSVFQLNDNKIHKLKSEPHFQKIVNNPLYGNIDRHYQDWQTSTYKNECFTAILNWVSQELGLNLTGWRIQGHQFRITANANNNGKPSPEGIHKDGADFVLIMLINRHNIRGGETTLYNNQRDLIESLTLSHPGDCILLDDSTVYHDTSQINPATPKDQAYRDTLVLTFHRPAE